MKTLVIGLGNPILGDDGVGWQVAQAVQKSLGRLPSLNLNQEIDVECYSLGGLSLMELMVNYDRAIVIDAISTGKTPAGHVSCFALESLTEPTLGHLASPHDTSLITALKVGRSLHARLPEQVTVIAIEITNKYEFSEQLTPAVAAAIPQAVKYVMENIL